MVNSLILYALSTGAVTAYVLLVIILFNTDRAFFTSQCNQFDDVDFGEFFIFWLQLLAEQLRAPCSDI